MAPTASRPAYPTASTSDPGLFEWSAYFMTRHTELIRRLNETTNGASIAASLLVIVSYAVIWKYNRPLARRVSLQQAVGISVADLISSSTSLIPNTVVYGQALPVLARCRALIWLGTFASNLPAWHTAMIALNLNITFLRKSSTASRGASPAFNYWYWYFIGAVSACLVISTGPLISAIAKGLCWPTDAYSPGGAMLAHIIYSRIAWFILPNAYTLVVAALCVAKLRRDQAWLDRMFSLDGDDKGRRGDGMPVESDSSSTLAGLRALTQHNLKQQSYRSTAKINRAIWRILCYTVYPIIQCIFNVSYLVRINGLSPYDYRHGREMSRWSVANAVIPNLGGLINSVVYLFDPAFRAYRLRIRWRVHTYLARRVPRLVGARPLAGDAGEKIATLPTTRPSSSLDDATSMTAALLPTSRRISMDDEYRVSLMYY
ncbi:hypothetical protein EV182_003904 [Spiromyces aspiralis]|uniref:Uncharacterized protein n=1 Tax=Spiromyces aspiralis TaxID=68401 RepID=A0ACC1HC38_9FUNG|nr:hypothetical protein EV182_003904 [Spiromyces aspiralis]